MLSVQRSPLLKPGRFVLRIPYTGVILSNVKDLLTALRQASLNRKQFGDRDSSRSLRMT